MRNFQFPPRQPAQDLLPLELTLLPRGSSRSQKYKIHDGKTLNKIFPSNPPSMKLLKFSNEISIFPEPTFIESKQKSRLDAQGLKIARLRQTFPHFNANSQKGISHLHLPCWKYSLAGFNFRTFKGISGPSIKCLNRIFKQAKNLKSVTLHPECGIATLKGLRKARDLQHLFLNIDGNQILACPQLFKGLCHLQNISMNIKSLPKESSKILKFFDCLLSLPRLQHLTIRGGDNYGHYKSLTAMMHTKNLPSFHIIRDVQPHSQSIEPFISWGNCIDTLYLGPILGPEDSSQSLDSQKVHEKRLSLGSPYCFKWDIKELLLEGSSSIRTLFIVNPFDLQPDFDEEKPLLEFLSKMKSLEDLTLMFESSFTNYSEIMNGIIGDFSQIKSLGGLKSLSFSLKNESDSLLKLLPPYGSIMKNLKVLEIKLVCKDVQLLYYTEALRELKNLEEFEFSYYENNKKRREIDCDIPLECLRNLKKINLTFNVRFSETSVKNFIEGIHKLENLKILLVSPEILMGIESKNGERLTKDLQRMKNLERAGFGWKEEKSGKLIYVVFQKYLNGEMKIAYL